MKTPYDLLDRAVELCRNLPLGPYHLRGQRIAIASDSGFYPAPRPAPPHEFVCEPRYLRSDADTNTHLIGARISAICGDTASDRGDIVAWRVALTRQGEEHPGYDAVYVAPDDRHPDVPA